MTKETKPAFWTHDDEPIAGHLYYFAPTNRRPPPYLKQRHVTAIIDIADDGTLAGVELIDNMPPPPVVVVEGVEGKHGPLGWYDFKGTEAWARDCLHWRGKVLTGLKAHWCYDWDGLPVDETTPEWPCRCFDEATVLPPAVL